MASHAKSKDMTLMDLHYSLHHLILLSTYKEPGDMLDFKEMDTKSLPLKSSVHIESQANQSFQH